MGKWRGAHVAVLLTLLGGLLAAAAAQAQDELFVANYGASSVTVYSRTAIGDTFPLRTLSGLATELQFPTALAVDLTHNELFVANGASITVYSRTASGNTFPLRTLSGFATALVSPSGVAVDLTHNELVVANSGNNSVTVYSRTASGNTAPLRTLSGVATGLINPAGVALDLINDELVVGNRANNSATVYKRTASGNTAPIRTLSGAATGLISPAGVAVTASAPLLPALVAAVLPNARAVLVSTPVTGNATVINAGSAAAVQVSIALASTVPASFGYWLLDTSASPPQLVGAPNTPVGIPACAPPAPCPQKSFLLFMTPTGAFGPTELSFTFAGINTPAVTTLVGVNTLLLLSSATPTPDMVAVAGTSQNDGIARIPGVTGTGFFVVATTNLGVGDTITVTSDTGGAVVPVDVQMCQSNPATGECLAPPTPTVTTLVAAGAQPTFAFFVRALGVGIPLDPAVNRVFARFRRSDNLIVGGTSVAVRTP